MSNLEMNGINKNLKIAQLSNDIKKLREKVNYYRYDDLTGLQKRKDMHLKFNDKFKGNKNAKICLVDINNLKEINRKYGYIEGGDNVIIRVADILVSLFEFENVYRIGGDEFLIFVEEKDYHKCKEDVEDLFILTCSETLDNYQDIDEIIKILDNKMIELKIKKDRRGNKQTFSLKDKEKLELTILLKNEEELNINVSNDILEIYYKDEYQETYLTEK